MQDLTPVIDKLAEKLGIASEYLISSLSQKVWVESLLFSIFSVAVFFWTVTYLRKWTPDEEKIDSYDGALDLVKGAKWVVVAMLVIFSCVGFFSSIGGVFYPEAAAIEKVISLLKGE